MKIIKRLFILPLFCLLVGCGYRDTKINEISKLVETTLDYKEYEIVKKEYNGLKCYVVYVYNEYQESGKKVTTICSYLYFNNKLTNATTVWLVQE